MNKYVIFLIDPKNVCNSNESLSSESSDTLEQTRQIFSYGRFGLAWTLWDATQQTHVNDGWGLRAMIGSAEPQTMSQPDVTASGFGDA